MALIEVFGLNQDFHKAQHDWYWGLHAFELLD